MRYEVCGESTSTLAAAINARVGGARGAPKTLQQVKQEDTPQMHVSLFGRLTAEMWRMFFPGL